MTRKKLVMRAANRSIEFSCILEMRETHIRKRRGVFRPPSPLPYMRNKTGSPRCKQTHCKTQDTKRIPRPFSDRHHDCNISPCKTAFSYTHGAGELEDTENKEFRILHRAPAKVQSCGIPNPSAGIQCPREYRDMLLHVGVMVQMWKLHLVYARRDVHGYIACLVAFFFTPELESWIEGLIPGTTAKMSA